MFIPLNSIDHNDWPNVLVAGDTAGVFYLLGLLSAFKLNAFVADTGVSGNSPLRFRAGSGRSRPDVAGAYYDFFEAPDRIGAGVIRRADMVLCLAGCGPVLEWARFLRVPSVEFQFLPAETRAEIEGVIPDPGSLCGCNSPDDALNALLTGFINAASAGRYRGTATLIGLERSGSLRVNPPLSVRLRPAIAPEETKYSAWDGINDVLEPGESLASVVGDLPLAVGHGHGNLRLVELGIPELHILGVRGEKERFVELTGDLARVFDGIL